MIAKLLVTVGIIFYAVVVPFFELNESHLFNPGWEPHVRLHEAWQLATNCAIGLFSCWLVWARGNIRLSCLMTFFVTGGFLLAYVLRDSYGGSMVLSDGSEKMILGINLGLFAYSLAIALALIALVLDARQASVRRPALS